MAINEKAAGPLYVAIVRVNERFVKPHKVDLTEMAEPWRIGKGVLLSFWPYRAIVPGWWRPTLDPDIEECFEDDRWLGPKWLDNTVEDIAQWSNGEAEQSQEEEA